MILGRMEAADAADYERTTGPIARSIRSRRKQTPRKAAFSRAMGSDGGSVKIQEENGRFQEERTYPGSKDPASSKG